MMRAGAIKNVTLVLATWKYISIEHFIKVDTLGLLHFVLDPFAIHLLNKVLVVDLLYFTEISLRNFFLSLSNFNTLLFNRFVAQPIFKRLPRLFLSLHLLKWLIWLSLDPSFFTLSIFPGLLLLFFNPFFKCYFILLLPSHIIFLVGLLRLLLQFMKKICLFICILLIFFGLGPDVKSILGLMLLL